MENEKCLWRNSGFLVRFHGNVPYTTRFSQTFLFDYNTLVSGSIFLKVSGKLLVPSSYPHLLFVCPRSNQRRRSTFNSFKYRAGQRLVTRVSDIKTTVLILDRYPNNRDHDQLQLHADKQVQQQYHFDSAVDCPVYVVRTHQNNTLLVPENQLTYR